MDKINISFFASNRTDTAEKLATNEWVRFAVGEPKNTVVVPIADRKAAIRAAAWIETHGDVEYQRGLAHWLPLATEFSDDSGVGYISTTFKTDKKTAFLPVPTITDFPAGWALLKVRNGRWSLSNPRQSNIKDEEVDEKAEEWGIKLDYVDALAAKDVALFVYTGDTEKHTDITVYLKQIIDNLNLTPAERAAGKRHAIVGGQIRKSIYQMTPRQVRTTSTDLPVDAEEPVVSILPFRALTKEGKAVVIDLNRIKGMATFKLLENGKEVTGYNLIWTSDPDTRYNLARSNATRYSKNLRYQVKPALGTDL
ncbi:hypothetical protein MUP59_05855, partial [Candidatus Bathyarchaeota archaeon]|nr:hypothetical protein [Candidatus Bathyarchaeota archaeon]